MKELNRKIDVFCMQHPRFGIPRLMLYVVIGNLVVWIFGMMDTTGLLYGLLALDPAAVCRGQIWRIVTFALIPVSGSNPLWLAVSLYFYYFIGTTLEREWGTGRFTIYYFSGMLLTALYAVLVYLIARISVYVTMYWLNMSLFFAFATLWPEQRVLLFFFIPVKMKWLAWVDAAYFALTIIRYLVNGYVWLALVPVVAMAAYMIFCGAWLIDLLRPSRARRRAEQKARTIRFRSAVRRVEREREKQPYSRKCAVCGRTDADHPELEFRFCSRCAGYHCFCRDHINNHIHFTE